MAIAPEFNSWRYEGANRKRQLVRFTHALGYFIEVPFNLMTGHQPDGRYKLKCRVVINGRNVNLVPFESSRPDFA